MANELISRYKSFKRECEANPNFTSVMDDESYIPPNKMAGYVPYDAIVGLEEYWEGEPLEAMLSTLDVTFDRVTGITENDSHEVDGGWIAFVSLQSYESQCE